MVSKLAKAIAKEKKRKKEKKKTARLPLHTAGICFQFSIANLSEAFMQNNSSALQAILSCQIMETIAEIALV